MAANDVALGAVLQAEGAKMLPLAASLTWWGFTLQEWTLVLGCAYAAGLCLDLVVRRWLIPVVRHLRAMRRVPPTCEVADDAD